jgi:FkbM family methyltransferase
MQLRMKDGTLLDLPASLRTITTYVILEQERWFEKETDFLLSWLKPDMTAIDVGANVGVYSLPMARRIRHVYAYEPGSDPRRHLERSRTQNRADNLEIIGAAVSDSSRDGHLVSSGFSELGRLSAAGTDGEQVRITSLDAEDSIRQWSPDLIKIDAEGEEARIIDGGRAFFDRHSPLVMFEISGPTVNTHLVNAFGALGYRTYRSLPGAPLLVPHNSGDPIDDFELNLFAAKPDRAANLAIDGFLLDAVQPWVPDDPARAEGLALLKAQKFSAAFPSLHGSPIDATYRDALAGYGAWKSSANYAALIFACEALTEINGSVPNLARQSTLARVAWEAGRRSLSMKTLEAFSERLKMDATVNEPFWPASPRFDRTAPSTTSWSDWFVASALEHAERYWRQSSYWGRPSWVNLEWLSSQPWVATEIERRRVLQAMRGGQAVKMPERLLHAAEDHLNADVWRDGVVQDAAEVGRMQPQA